MITEFIEHLKISGVRPAVRLAFTTEPIEDYEDDLPVILPYPGGMSAERSIGDNCVVQNAGKSIVCLMGCKIEDHEILETELHAAALGWVLGIHDAMELSGVEIVGIKGGYVWSKITYYSAVRIRQSN